MAAIATAPLNLEIMKTITQKEFDKLLAVELEKAAWYSKAFSKSEYFQLIELYTDRLKEEYKVKKLK